MVFSPYSYLVDPVIRRALDISAWAVWLVGAGRINVFHSTTMSASQHGLASLVPGAGCPGPTHPSAGVEGNMLVFDEAHNMEDVAREAASMHLPAPEVLEVGGGRRGGTGLAWGRVLAATAAQSARPPPSPLPATKPPLTPRPPRRYRPPSHARSP